MAVNLKRIFRRVSYGHHAFIFFVLLVLCLTALSVSGVLRLEFTNRDDPVYLLENTSVRSFSWPNLRRIFSETIYKAYSPLSTLSFAAEYHFFKYIPFYYHLDNLLLHVGVTAWVMLFARTLGVSRRASLLAGLLFGIHPLHVEPVAWVAARKNVLYALFYVPALCAYSDYLAGFGHPERRTARRKTMYALTIFLALLSILAEAMALTLPLVFLLLDWYHRRPWSKRLLLEKIPHLCVVAPVALITYFPRIMDPGRYFSEAMLLFWAATFYLKKFLFPWPLLPHYPVPAPMHFFPGEYLTATLLVLVLAYLLCRFRRRRLFVFAVLFYAATVFFLLKADNRADAGIVADRYMYIPSVGFCCLAAAWFDQLLNSRGRRRPLVICFLIMIYSSLAMQTYFQVRVWRNSLTLWSHALRFWPDNALFWLNRGSGLSQQERYPEALSDYQHALSLNPELGKAYYNMAYIYYLQEQDMDALEVLEKELKINDRDIDGYFLKGNILQRNKALLASIDTYTHILTIDPTHVLAWNNRAIAHAKLGHDQQALEGFTQALRLDPMCGDCYLSRGNFYLNKKEYYLALQNYDQALKVNPQDGRVYFLKAVVYKEMNRMRKAGGNY